MNSLDRNKKHIVLDNITREFLGSLKELRIMHGFTYRHVTECIGVSERILFEYVQGVKLPTIKPLMNLAEIFRADLSGSLNYKYWHGQIDFTELRRELSENGLTHRRLSLLTGYSERHIEATVNDCPNISLECLSAVIEILNRVRNGEKLPYVVEKDIKGCRYKRSCPDEVTLEFLRSLKSLRVSMGLTQKELARMIGITHEMLARYETGRYMPTVNILMRLVEILGYDLSESINSKYTKREIPYRKIKRGLNDYGLSISELGQITNYAKSTISLALRKRVDGSLKVLSDVIGVIDNERESYRLAHEITPVKRKRRKSPCQK